MSIADLLCRLFCRVRVPEARMAYDLFLGGFQLKEVTMENINLNTAQKVSIVARPMVGNRPATIQGNIGVSVTHGDPENPAISIEIDTETNSFTVFGIAPGTSQVVVTGDADLDDGEVREITNTVRFVVVMAEADRLDLEIGEIEPM